VAQEEIDATRHNLKATYWKYEMQLVAAKVRMSCGGSRNTGSAQTWWNHRSLMNPHPGQYSTTSLSLLLVTMSGHPERPRICSPYCRDKLLTLYTVSQPEQHMKTLLGLLKAVTETTSCRKPTSFNWRSGSSWMMNHSKSLQQLSGSWHTGSLLDYLWTSFRLRPRIHLSMGWDWELKQQHLMDSNRSLKALNQDLKLEVAKAAAGTPARLTVSGVTGDRMGMQSPPVVCCRDGRTVCWQCGNASHLNRDWQGGHPQPRLEKTLCNQRKGQHKKVDSSTTPTPYPLVSHFCLMRSDCWRLVLQLWKDKTRSWWQSC
jgi:hypothetical protein